MKGLSRGIKENGGIFSLDEEMEGKIWIFRVDSWASSPLFSQAIADGIFHALRCEKAIVEGLMVDVSIDCKGLIRLRKIALPGHVMASSIEIVSIKTGKLPKRQ